MWIVGGSMPAERPMSSCVAMRAIDRDDWVRQADALARGGVEEYIRVFGKKPV